jgi:hypothetical protein
MSRSSRFTMHLVLLSAVLALLVLPPVVSTARAQGRGRADMKTLASYRLTMPTVRKLLSAARAAEADPAYRQSPSLEKVEGMSLAEFTAAIDRNPATKRAVARAGLSTREWATAWASFMWAVRVLAEQEMARGMGRRPRRLPAHVPHANVNLVRQNQAEIERLGDVT